MCQRGVEPVVNCCASLRGAGGEGCAGSHARGGLVRSEVNPAAADARLPLAPEQSLGALSRLHSEQAMPGCPPLPGQGCQGGTAMPGEERPRLDKPESAAAAAALHTLLVVAHPVEWSRLQLCCDAGPEAGFLRANACI